MGVAAAEVGLKKLIGSLVPDAAWLVDELQLPSLSKLLRKYLPTLPVKYVFVGKARRPPNSLVNRIEKAVEFRNKVAHTGAVPPGQDDLDDMLRAIDDFLYICDFYAGYTWAAEFISHQMLVEWKND